MPSRLPPPGLGALLLLALLAGAAPAVAAAPAPPSADGSPEPEDVPLAKKDLVPAARAPGEAAEGDSPEQTKSLLSPVRGYGTLEPPRQPERSPGDPHADGTDDSPRMLRPKAVPAVRVDDAQGLAQPGHQPLEDEGETPQESAPLVRFSITATAAGAFAYDLTRWLTEWELAARPDLIVRKGPKGLGAGLYLEGGGRFGPRGASGLVGGGAVFVAPVADVIAVVPSLGGFATQRGPHGWQPGVTLGSFFGFRFDDGSSPWEAPFGLRVDFRYGFGPVHEWSGSIGIQLDPRALWFFLVPFMPIGTPG